MTDAPDPDMPAAAPIPERLRAALGLAEGGGEADALAAVARLRERPDPARFVPVAAMRELMAERHAGAAACAEQDVGRKLEDALARGCISRRWSPGPRRFAGTTRRTSTPSAKAAAERIEARLRAAGHAPAELPPALHDHRPGRRDTLATDPELRAFAEARFNRMTFERIADAAEAHFGERRLAKSAIHDRYDKNHRRAK